MLNIDKFIITPEEKAEIQKLLKLDETFPNPDFQKEVNDLIVKYDGITNLPQLMSNLLIYTKNIDEETRRDLLAITTSENSIKYLLLVDDKTKTDQETIDLCIRNVLAAPYKCITKNNHQNNPQLFNEALNNLNHNIANRFIECYGKNVLLNPEFRFLLQATSNEKIVKDMYPQILNNNSIAKIISNPHLSESFRLSTLQETQLTDVENLTPKLKEELFNYYVEAFFVPEQEDISFLGRIIAKMTEKPNAYLTPELELELLDKIEYHKRHSCDQFKTAFVDNLCNYSTNSKTLRRCFELSYFHHQNIALLQNKNWKEEDIVDVALALLMTAHNSNAEHEQRVAFTKMVEILNTPQGNNALNESVKLQEEIENFLNEIIKLQKDLKATKFTGDNDMADILLSKLTCIPELPRNMKEYILKHSKFQETKELVSINNKLKELDIPFEFKKDFLRTVSHLYYLSNYMSEQEQFSRIDQIGENKDIGYFKSPFSSNVLKSISMPKSLSITELSKENIKELNKLLRKIQITTTINKIRNPNRAVVNKAMKLFTEKINDAQLRLQNIQPDISELDTQDIYLRFMDIYGEFYKHINPIDAFRSIEFKQEEIKTLINLLYEKEHPAVLESLNKSSTIRNLFNVCKEEPDNKTEKEYSEVFSAR